MDAYAARASRVDRRITLDRLARARRRGEIDNQEYRLRRQLARRAETVADLQALLQDVEDYQQGKDHWRFGRWRGPVREGHELEIQRFVGFAFIAIALIAVVACVYVGFALYEHWK
jgi:Flp pilus assembly protein TadB